MPSYALFSAVAETISALPRECMQLCRYRSPNDAFSVKGELYDYGRDSVSGLPHTVLFRNDLIEEFPLKTVFAACFFSGNTKHNAAVGTNYILNIFAVAADI